MKKIFKIILVIFTLQILLSDQVYLQSDDTVKIESISGVLVKINKAKLVVLIKSDKRFVRFYATPEICAEFKNKIYSKVNVTFKRKNGIGLQLVTIKIIPKTEADPLNPDSINNKLKPDNNK